MEIVFLKCCPETGKKLNVNTMKKINIILF
jgi:hypothetical protein